MRKTLLQMLKNEAGTFLLVAAALELDPSWRILVETCLWILTIIACHYTFAEINLFAIAFGTLFVAIFAMQTNALRPKDPNRKSFDLAAELSFIDRGDGNAFEAKMVEYLKASRLFRYPTITEKTRGDKGGDIEVLFLNSKCIIQCKAHHATKKQGKIRGNTTGISAICEVLFAREFYEAKYAIVATNTKFSKFAIDFANAYNVYLFDRKALEALITNDEYSIVSAMPPMVRAASGFSRTRRLSGKSKGPLRKSIEKATHSIDRLYLKLGK